MPLIPASFPQVGGNIGSGAGLSLQREKTTVAFPVCGLVKSVGKMWLKNSQLFYESLKHLPT